MNLLTQTKMWPRDCSEAVTADSKVLGWQCLHALACDFDASADPLRVPGDPEFLTLEINTASQTSVSYEFGDTESAETEWRPGDIFIYPNFEKSRWTWDKQHSTVVFFFPYSRLKQIIMQNGDNTLRHPVLIPGMSRNDNRLRHLLQLISAEMLEEEPNGDSYVGHLVDATLTHLAKNYVTECEDVANERCLLSSQQLAKIRQHVVDYVDTPISVADLADVAGVKQFEFPRVFRSSVGITPYQYILQERVDWAEHLLQSTDMSLAEISYTAGFSSQSHFTRTFRKQKGVTPQSSRRALI